jgi:hypothetical protein
MLNPSDKELDRLSREAADHFEPDEQILSWEQLVPRLDREIGVKPNTGYRIFGRGSVGYIVAVIAIIGVSVFVFKQRKASGIAVTPKSEISNSPADKNQRLQKADASSSGIKNEKINSEIQKAGNDQNTSSETASKDNSKGTVESATDASNNSSTIAKEKYSNGVSSESSTYSKKGMPTTGSRANVPNQGNSFSSKAGNKTKVNIAAAGTAGLAASSNGNDQSINNRQTNNSIPKATPNNTSKDFSVSNTALQEDMKMADLELLSLQSQKGAISTQFTLKTSSHSQLELSSAAINQSKNTQRALRMNRALKIGVLYGSDVTSVHSVAPGRLSQNWGMTLGYQLHNHWSINTGVIYTQKNYSANGKDFHAKMPPSTPAYKLDYVDGNCNMWEIPLTLRYDFDRINNTTLFLNAGASSYLMRHESYVYYVSTWNSGTLVSRATPPMPYDTKENYLFSVIDISFGVEQRLTKSLSFQVEPYGKIPVKGVGLGSVDLSSYGVNLSLRFSPLLKSSRK